MWPYSPWMSGGPLYGGGASPINFDPWNAGNPGGVPLPPAGGGGGFFDGIGGIIGDILDIVEDVDDIIDIFSGGGGGGNGSGSGLPFPTAGGGSGTTPFSNLIGSVGGGDSSVLVANIGNQSAEEEAFINFLRAIGVGITIVNWLWENPPISWPKIAADMFAAWFANGRPSGPDTTITPLVPPEWMSGGGTSLPTPAPTNMPVPGFTGSVAPMAMPAYATQVYKAPKGYVTVSVPSGNGTSTKMFVAKKVAVAMGLYKNRKKAPITGKEYHYIKKAKAWETKLARMMGDSCNYKVTKKRR